ncbi:hypothetical protein HPP92_021002 [Vanilla planifolia]|uniref:Uncharacterized protein n=1 Tax=Vanilla planifolia TaxID=51239 RepID=A0A835UH55_VANPL|nr:hypothetical protein HPP92_021002 [Vanilla planifolia]
MYLGAGPYWRLWIAGRGRTDVGRLGPKDRQASWKACCVEAIMDRLGPSSDTTVTEAAERSWTRSASCPIPWRNTSSFGRFI